jgi:hypothetical protein
MATKTTKKKPTKTLKIKSKREKTKARKSKKVDKKRLVVKMPKLNRMLKKVRSMTKKAIKTATKGLSLKKIPERLYKHIDSAIAKNEALQAAVIAAVTAEVNAIAKKEKTPAEASA